MIALLRGVLIEKSPNQAVVDVGGVGYDVTIPVSTFSALAAAGTEVRLRIHTHAVSYTHLRPKQYSTLSYVAIYTRPLATESPLKWLKEVIWSPLE